MQTYGIGGNEVPSDASESFADIPKNRTLIVEKLTDKPAVKAEVIENLKTIDEVFEHFKPSVKMEFEDADGASQKEELSFRNLGDFGANGITKQSAFLQGYQTKKDEYQKIVKQLKANKTLRNIIADPEKKAAMLEAIQVLIKELNQTQLK